MIDFDLDKIAREASESKLNSIYCSTNKIERKLKRIQKELHIIKYIFGIVLALEIIFIALLTVALFNI